MARSEQPYRPLNDWGSGDLPAPWAIGDRVSVASDAAVLVGLNDSRIGRQGPRDRGAVAAGDDNLFVCDAYSIDEGDGWYFRLCRGRLTRNGNLMEDGPTTDRLHVYVDHEDPAKTVDWMAGVTLVETQCLETLQLRNRMLAEGWSPPPPPRACECCGQTIHHQSRNE